MMMTGAVPDTMTENVKEIKKAEEMVLPEKHLGKLLKDLAMQLEVNRAMPEHLKEIHRHQKFLEDWLSRADHDMTSHLVKFDRECTGMVQEIRQDFQRKGNETVALCRQEFIRYLKRWFWGLTVDPMLWFCCGLGAGLLVAIGFVLGVTLAG